MARTRGKPARIDTELREGNTAPEGHDYVVMGDLGPVAGSRRRDQVHRYVVRMFIRGIHPGADVHDDEFECNVEDLHDAVTTRMGKIASKPDPKLRVPVKETTDHMTLTGQHPGHAVPVPGHWLSSERDQYHPDDVGDAA